MRSITWAFADFMAMPLNNKAAAKRMSGRIKSRMDGNVFMNFNIFPLYKPQQISGGKHTPQDFAARQINKLPGHLSQDACG
jgi:hypothetical protein